MTPVTNGGESIYAYDREKIRAKNIVNEYRVVGVTILLSHVGTEKTVEMVETYSEGRFFSHCVLSTHSASSAL